MSEHATDVGASIEVRQPRRQNTVGRDRILAAAYELFAHKGYAATSTRDIAEAVGVRQPSLYYHFRTKSQILLEVLLQSIAPTLVKAAELDADPSLAPKDRLLALVDFDVRLLVSSNHNQVVLYLLPELDEDVFMDFRNQFDTLRDYYRRFVLAVSFETDGPLRGDALVGVVFSLIEGIIFRRTYELGLDAEDAAAQTCEAVSRLVG